MKLKITQLGMSLWGLSTLVLLFLSTNGIFAQSLATTSNLDYLYPEYNRVQKTLPGKLESSRITIAQALDYLKQKFEVNFSYLDDLKSMGNISTLVLDDNEINPILSSIFRNTPFQYKEVSPGFYVIYSAVRKNTEISKKSISLSQVKLPIERQHKPYKKVEYLPSSDRLLQEIKEMAFNISGQVVDQEGEPLIGVNILVKGTNKGTATDFEGRFTLEDIDENAVLVVSYVGYHTQEVAVAGKSNLTITLLSDSQLLDEVVVVGYGTQKKVNLTGSVSTVNAEELTSVPMPNIAQSIMGKASGVFVKNTNGQPGETETSFNIRGFGSPLLIIDGMPASAEDFKLIDPNDIKNFSVLKDAASAAVYGARAGNGVILITTKRGAVSEAKVTYTGNYGVQFFPVVPDFVSSEQYARMENLSRYNQGLEPVWTEEQIQRFADGSDPNRYPNNDWWSLTLRKYAPQSQHNINVQGGTDKVKYFVSGGYFYQEAQPRTNDTKYKKYNLRSNLDVTLSKKLNMRVDITLQYQDFLGPVFQMERTRQKSGIMGKIYRHRPFGPSADQYPDPNVLTSYPGADINPVIYSEMDNSGYKSWNTMTGDLKFNFYYQLPLGIEAKANYRLYRRYDRDKQYELKTPVYNYDWDTQEYSLRSYLNDPSRLNEGMQVNNNIDQQYYLTWNKEFEEHSINALAVYEILSDDYNRFDASRIRYDFDIDYLFAGPELDKDNGGSAGEGGRKGLISRLNYGYKGKYLVEFNSRYDASPRFPKETRWGFFPSASVGWRLSEESFIKDNLYFVDNLKLRASYGKLGYDNTGQFQYLETFQLTSSYIYDETTNEVSKGIRADAIPNPKITWEKMTATNIGLDFSFWQSKLEGSLDYFYRDRTDVLGSRIASLPNTVGANLPQVNYAEFDNRGLELVLLHRNSVGDFQYNFGGNIAWNREKTIFIDQDEFASHEALRRGNKIGEWTDNFWGVMTDGLFQSHEEIENWADQDGRNNATILPGDVKKIDYNGDGRITSDDNVIIGRGVFPKLFYGMNMSLAWKAFEFNMLWQGAGLFDVNVVRAPDYRLPFYAGNTPFTFMLNEAYVPEGNPWLPANTTNAKFPLYRTDQYNRGHPSYQTSDFWLTNGAYLRLKTIELGYTLPSSLFGKWGIDQCKFYLSGYNILTFSALTKFYMDPEIDTSTARVMGNYYPPVGTYNLGVLLKF